MSSDGKYQTAVVNNGDIYLSSDYGVTWTVKDTTNREWYGIAMSSNGKYQTAVAWGNAESGMVLLCPVTASIKQQ
jgi:hypothetical protein